MKIDFDDYKSRKQQNQIEAASKQITTKKQEIKYDTRDYVVKYLVEEFLDDQFFVPASYQRLFVWTPKDKSYFIESILMGLPIPFMFFADSDDGRIEIVDGAQRTQTLVEFLNNDLELSDLKILNKLNGFKFGDLESPLKNRFGNTNVRVVYLDEGTTIESRQEIFKRINTGGMALKPAEARRGSHEGAFKDFLETCQKNSIFNELAPRTPKTEQRFEGIELLTRFFAYLDNYDEEYSTYDGNVSNYLDRYVEKMNESFNAELQKRYTKDFENMLNYSKMLLKDLGFRKTTTAASTPRARFEALSVGIALALRENPQLAVRPNMDWIESEDFKYHTRSDAANNKNRLIGRIKYVKNKLLEE